MLETLCVWGFSIATLFKVVCLIMGFVTALVGVIMTDDSRVSAKTCLKTVLSGAALIAIALLFPTESAWETLLEIARRP